MVIYLHVADNNKAPTVLSFFQQAIPNYGLPARIRSDMGGENTAVAQFLLNHPSRGSGCMITGRSVHNQRIKRLWRDVFAECTSYFYTLFYALEENGVNKITIAKQIYLHCILFIWRIFKSNSINSKRAGTTTECEHAIIELRFNSGCLGFTIILLDIQMILLSLGSVQMRYTVLSVLMFYTF